MILHLGVIDIPYVQPPLKRQRKARAGTKTTGDVAGYLENRYHVMEIYYQERQGVVANAVAESLKGAVESLLMGAPASLAPFGTATSDIEDDLKQFILTGE